MPRGSSTSLADPGSGGKGPRQEGYRDFTNKNQPRLMQNMGSQRQVEQDRGRIRDPALFEKYRHISAVLGTLGSFVIP